MAASVSVTLCPRLHYKTSTTLLYVYLALPCYTLLLLTSLPQNSLLSVFSLLQVELLYFSNSSKFSLL